MCNKRESVQGVVIVDGLPKQIRVDSCIRHLILSLSNHGYNTVGCCCGHGRYPMTIICRVDGTNRYYDLISGVDVKSKRGGGWYILDNDGYYYVPEVINKN